MSAPRIFDTVLFGGELDMLELRLRHLDGLVDRHVIAEADLTFSGQPRRLVFPDHVQRFAPWHDRLFYIRVRADELPREIDDPVTYGKPVYNMCPHAWERERAQRDALWQGMAGATADDLVLLGDLDEIPDRWVLTALKADPPLRPVCLAMRAAVFAVDWVHPRLGLNTIAMHHGQLKSFSEGHIRSKNLAPAIHGAGWHFSWLGGPAAIEAKADAHAHQELSAEIHRANAAGLLYERGWLPWDDTQLLPVDTDRTWPEWIASRQCPESWFRPR